MSSKAVAVEVPEAAKVLKRAPRLEGVVTNALIGGLSFFLFMLLTVTASFLMFSDRPLAAAAWPEPCRTLEDGRHLGFVVREYMGIDWFRAHLMVRTLFLHHEAAYSKPRAYKRTRATKL